MSKLLELTNTFYEASRDLSERVCFLPNQLTSEPDTELNPDAILQKYKAEVMAFLDLDGTDVPREHFVTYDQLETTVRSEVFPAYEVLTETWNELMENPSTITQATKLELAHHCIHVVNLIEMTIVPITEELRNDLQLQPA